MIQVALMIVSIALIGIGIKGFTPSGLQLSKNTTLNGTAGKVVGTLCILFGLALIPIFIVIFMQFSN